MAQADQSKPYLIGVDFGGTKILSAVFDSDLNCLGRSKKKTKAERGKEAVIVRIADCVHEACADAGVELSAVSGLGIGAPGAIDLNRGVVVAAPNLGWSEVPLQSALHHELNVPVFLQNDCNVALQGILEKEFPSTPKSLIGIFVGTGIGGGIMFNGQPYSGATGTAGEIGHMIIRAGGPQCSCGNRGCLESLASRKAIYRQLENRMKGGEVTSLSSDTDLEGLRSRALRKAIKHGDPLVTSVVENAAENIGLAVGSLINILGPEVVVLGGGVIDALEMFMLGPIIETAREVALGEAARQVPIVASTLGDDAGIVGGAVIARKAIFR